MADPRLVTVFSGPLWQGELLKGRLEEDGIPVYLPDHTTKVVDPFITGGNPLLARLQVREEDAQRATELIEAERATHDTDEDDDEYELTPQEEVDYLGQRSLWWALLTAFLMISFPIMLGYGLTYLRATRAYRLKAPRHGLVLGAVGIVTVWVGLAVTALVTILRS